MVEPRKGIGWCTADMAGEELLAAKLRGEVEGKMSLSFVDELQAQVEKLEKKILDAEAVGKDSGGDQGGAFAPQGTDRALSGASEKFPR